MLPSASPARACTSCVWALASSLRRSLLDASNRAAAHAIMPIQIRESLHWPECCACPLVVAFDPGCLAQTGHLTGASTSAARQRAHDVERTATMQAPAELVEWLRCYGFHREAVAAVESMAFMVEPTLATTQANVDALQSVLRMDDAQVRLVRAFDAAAACCARTVLVCMCMHCRATFSCKLGAAVPSFARAFALATCFECKSRGAQRRIEALVWMLLCICVCFACLSSSTCMHVCVPTSRQ